MFLSFPVYSAGPVADIKIKDWGFSGPFGKYDKSSLQRGLQVYIEVCSSCHSLKYIAYRNLSDLGYNKEEIKAFASTFTVVDGPDDEGEMFERPGVPADYFVSPYPNMNAARAANGGAYPPDLSLIKKARVGGADYLYSLLIGYKEPPEDMEVRDGLYYNKYYGDSLINIIGDITFGIIGYCFAHNFRQIAVLYLIITQIVLSKYDADIFTMTLGIIF